MGRFLDLTGQRFHYLTVIRRCDKPSKRIHWVCECDCGRVKSVDGSRLKNGNTKSCGCYNMSSESKTIKHGLRSNPLYHCYTNMIDRCYRKTHKSFLHYGGRGISVCDEWMKNDYVGMRSFVSWAENNGYADGLQLDREENNGNYEPSNCRFVTPSSNIINQRLRKDNSSGYKGISWHKNQKKWQSMVTIKGNRKTLIMARSIEEALNARNNYILEHKLPHAIQEYVE